MSKPPLCLRCGKRRAKVLRKAPAYVAFCSLACAARYAIEEAYWREWCPVHCLWSHVDDGCWQCKRDDDSAE